MITMMCRAAKAAMAVVITTRMGEPSLYAINTNDMSSAAIMLRLIRLRGLSDDE